MTEKWFQLKLNCRTGVCPRGAHVRHRCGRSLSPLSSMKTIVRPWRAAFFYLGPAHLLPVRNGLLIVLPRLAHRPLAAPPQAPEHAPHVPRMVPDPEPALDHLRHPLQRPERGPVSRRPWPRSEQALQPPQLCRRQLRFPSRPPRVLEARPPLVGQLLLPAIHRLAVHPQLAGDLGLRAAAREQPHGRQAPLLQRLEIPFPAGWMSHPSNLRIQPS